MRRRNGWPSVLALAALITSLTIPAAPAEAQDPPPRRPTTVPRVFFDCRGPECDSTYYRTEINWVAWVRDQRDAHVHVIMTSQRTGVGGREYLLDFLGRGAYQNYETRSTYQSLPTDTQRERLDGVALTLGLGLATFATESGYRNVVQLDGIAPVGEVNANLDTPPEGILSPDDVEDPWHLWVFRINANGNFDGESTTTEYRLNSSVSGSRVTPTWKQSYRVNVNYRNLEQERTDSTLITDIRRDYGVNADVVYSLAEHWSVGFNAGARRDTRRNRKLMAQVNPAFEYSFFPYEEATRRSLTAYYEIGPVYQDYFEETRDGEFRPVSSRFIRGLPEAGFPRFRSAGPSPGAARRKVAHGGAGNVPMRPASSRLVHKLAPVRVRQAYSAPRQRSSAVLAGPCLAHSGPAKRLRPWAALGEESLRVRSCYAVGLASGVR